MLESTGYYTIGKEGHSEIREMASKFYGIAFHCPDKTVFDQYLLSARNTYQKATHYCTAYRFDVNDLNWKADDDGEPSGTAGFPILSQLKSSSLFYSAIIVVRYYGGTKLGASGLINAYRNCAQLAVNNSSVIWHEITVTFQLDFQIEDYAKIQTMISHAKKWILSFNFLNNNRLMIRINLSDKSKLEKTVFEFMNGYEYLNQKPDRNNWSLTELL